MRQLLLPNFLKEIAVPTLILRILTSTNDPIRVRVSVISSTTAVFKPSSLQCGGFLGAKKKCKESDVQGDGRVPNQIGRSVTKGTTDLARTMLTLPPWPTATLVTSPYQSWCPLLPSTRAWLISSSSSSHKYMTCHWTASKKNIKNLSQLLYIHFQKLPSGKQQSQPTTV